MWFLSPASPFESTFVFCAIIKFFITEKRRWTMIFMNRFKVNTFASSREFISYWFFDWHSRLETSVQHRIDIIRYIYEAWKMKFVSETCYWIDSQLSRQFMFWKHDRTRENWIVPESYPSFLFNPNKLISLNERFTFRRLSEQIAT